MYLPLIGVVFYYFTISCKGYPQVKDLFSVGLERQDIYLRIVVNVFYNYST